MKTIHFLACGAMLALVSVLSCAQQTPEGGGQKPEFSRDPKGSAEGNQASGVRGQESGKAPAEPAADEGPKKLFPGVTIDLKEKYVDLEGAVCLREGLLELVAVTPNTKEHEAIVSLKVRPSRVHAALLMLGLKPGTPGRWEYKDDKAVPVDPTGDRVKLSLRWQQDGKWVEKPINEFILHKQSDKHMESDEFVFAGSRVYKPEDGGDPVYLADQSGDLVSLVSFDVELLSLPKAASKANDAVFWTADPKAIPELGTPVVLRIRPAKAINHQGTKDTKDK